MEVPRYWRMRGYYLRFERPRLHPNPGEIVMEHLPKKGEVYSFTEVSAEAAPAEFEDQAPYFCGLVKLENGELLTTRFTDLDSHTEERIVDGEMRSVTVHDIYIGMPVEMVTRKKREQGERGIIVYGPSFRPLVSSSSK